MIIFVLCLGQSPEPQNYPLVPQCTRVCSMYLYRFGKFQRENHPGHHHKVQNDPGHLIFSQKGLGCNIRITKFISYQDHLFMYLPICIWFVISSSSFFDWYFFHVDIVAIFCVFTLFCLQYTILLAVVNLRVKIQLFEIF